MGEGLRLRRSLKLPTLRLRITQVSEAGAGWDPGPLSPQPLQLPASPEVPRLLTVAVPCLSAFPEPTL